MNRLNTLKKENFQQQQKTTQKVELSLRKTKLWSHRALIKIPAKDVFILPGFTEKKKE